MQSQQHNHVCTLRPVSSASRHNLFPFNVFCNFPLLRWIHAPSGRVYSYSYKPPKVKGKDDITGDDLIQRDDDKPDCVRKRLAAYDEVTAPLVDFYEKKGVLKTFQGTMSDVIYPEVKDWLDEKLLHDHE